MASHNQESAYNYDPVDTYLSHPSPFQTLGMGDVSPPADDLGMAGVDEYYEMEIPGPPGAEGDDDAQKQGGGGNVVIATVNGEGSSAQSQKMGKQGSSSGKKRGRGDQDDNDSPGDEGTGHMPGTIFKNAFNAEDVENGDDDDDEDEPNPKAKKPRNLSVTGQPGGFQLVDKDGDSMRRKIRIEYIGDKSRRHITFSKRKAGIMKKAYELSTLTGTQVLLLVVSETGLVYTFTTAKLQPLVTKAEGKNLIQACLNSPEGVGPDGEPTAIAAVVTTKKERKSKDKDGLAIRPMKLDAASIANLANSATAAGDLHHSSPGDARPRKRLPSGKGKKVATPKSKNDHQGALDPELDGHKAHIPPAITIAPPQQQHLGQGISPRGQDMQSLQSQSPMSATFHPSVNPDYRHPSQGPQGYYHPHPSMNGMMPPNSPGGYYGGHPGNGHPYMQGPPSMNGMGGGPYDQHLQHGQGYQQPPPQQQQRQVSQNASAMDTSGM